MADLNEKLSWGLVQLGCNVPDNYASSNDATHKDIVETWVHSDPVPNEQAILDAYDVWVIEQEKIKYRTDREFAYPSVGDQLDMIYKDMKNSTTTHADAVEAVKTKWPKDNSGPVE